jgi:mono/diheme cytochrome c family protein
VPAPRRLPDTRFRASFGRAGLERKTIQERGVGICAAAVLALALGVVAGMSGAARAQDLARGKQLYEQKAGCGYCHGWAGDGQGDPRSEGGAPSLRISELSLEQVTEVIQCGRPGTGMPHHDRFAYTDKRCYDATADDLGAMKPARSDQTLQKAEILAIADYVKAKIIGRGPVTREQCIEFFGQETNECLRYPKAGG